MKTINQIAAGAFLFILCPFMTQAQMFTGGIVGGVSTGEVRMQHIDEGFNDVVTGKNIMGFEAGAFVRLKAGPVYVKPMALYTHQSGHVTFNDQSVAYRANKVGVPVMFGVNILGPVSIEAGPVYNYLVDVTQNFDNTRDWNVGQNGLGYRAGLVFDIGPLMVNAAYEGMTYDIGNSSRTGFREPHKLIFGAGLKFGGGGKKD
ncbi:MAG: hypothetical protein K0R65_2930 [Crocinitomicaceae bacterium]|jgi:hypothetical protein|nr:hypothetical protein [Crocinitomicaceae bacterium]